jgi:hypothetical protein
MAQIFVCLAFVFFEGQLGKIALKSGLWDISVKDYLLCFMDFRFLCKLLFATTDQKF